MYEIAPFITEMHATDTIKCLFPTLVLSKEPTVYPEI